MSAMITEEALTKVERIKRIEEVGLNTPNFIKLFLPLHFSSELPWEKVEPVMNWAREIDDKKQSLGIPSVFNIRTYKHVEKTNKESMNTSHITDIPFTDLLETIIKMKHEYNGFTLMVDSEMPDNGIISGNILIEEADRLQEFFTKKAKYLNVHIEFVAKPERAMVRDINSEPSFVFNYKVNSFNEEDVYSKVCDFIFSHKKLALKSISKDLGLINKMLEAEKIILNLEETNKRSNGILGVLTSIIMDAIKFYRERQGQILEFTFFKTKAGKNFDNLVWWEYRRA